MAKQVVNTDGIASATNQLRTANDTINREFDTMKKAVKVLETNWKGAAGEVAQTTMYQLFRNNEVRTTVLQNYINLLEQQVHPGYVNAETANTTLADKFK